MSPSPSVLPKKLPLPGITRENGFIFIEQIFNSVWNFGLGTFVAKWADIQTFGFFATILSVYFILTGAVSAMTIGVVAIDASRLKLSRSLYLHHARRGAERVAILALVAGVCAVWVIAWHAPENERLTMGFLGTLYLNANLILDIRRRIFALQKNLGPLVLIALFRVVFLGCLILSALVWLRSYGLELVSCGAVLISLLSVWLFAFFNQASAGRARGLAAIAFARQIRLGGWLFASSVAGNFFEQGIAIASGMNGLPQLVGAWRAGSFLFSFLNPLLQLADLLLPKLIAERLGRHPSLHKIALFTGLFGSLGAVLTFAIAVLNAQVWLPYLGRSYTGLSYVAVWYWGIYTAILIRTSLMPFLKTKAPISIFLGSLLGNASGIFVFVIAGSWSLRTICLSVFVSNAVSLVFNIFTLVFLQIRSIRLQAYPRGRRGLLLFAAVEDDR